MTRKETIPCPPGVTGLGLPTAHPGWDFHWSCGRRFNPSCRGPAPVPTGSQVVSCQHPLLWGRRMKGEVGAESQEEGAQDKKPSRRLRQRQAELSAEGVRTHKHTDLSPRDNACRARAQGCGRGWGSLWREGHSSKPRASNLYPCSSQNPSPTPSTHTTKHVHRQACSSRKSLSYSDTTPPPRLLWIGREPGLTQPPHRTAPPPSPGSRKGEGPGDALGLSPRVGGGVGRTPTSWPEESGRGMDERPEDPSFQHPPPRGYPVSGKRMVWVLCPCVVSLVSGRLKSWGLGLAGRAWRERIGHSSSVGGGRVKLPQAGRQEGGWWLGSVCTGGQRGVLFRRILGKKPTRASC